MLSAPVLILASAALAWAAPSCTAVRGPVLPKTGAARELPPPPAGTTLKKIALGFGVQNYTCDSNGKKAVATGALAMLYDITRLYPGQSAESLSVQEFNNLPAKVLSTSQVPLNLGASSEGHAPARAYGSPASAYGAPASAYGAPASSYGAPSAYGSPSSGPFPPDSSLSVEGMETLPFLGHHFFNADGVPVFVLDGGRTNMPAAKEDAVNPPAGAYAGPDGTGAVAWLFLRGIEGAVGAKYVYRVLTAGGTSHGCGHGAGEDSTSYAATYWFYD